MELSDKVVIAAPRDEVYRALNDPETLEACIPGCEELVKKSDTEFEARVLLKIGPVKARFTGTVTLDPSGAPEHFSLQGEGSGGTAGFAKGGADVHLAEEAGETTLSYEARADIGGKLAQLGSRLVQSTAKKLSNQFFRNFAKTFEEAEAG